MKTKNIFKALALAMLMPAMLLTTACSSEDDAIVNNNETTAKKGYELPVTINVTRQGDATTRTTYTDNGNGTGSLAFSTGDKLFVGGRHNAIAGSIVGMLTWVSGGTFSGTITTKNEWTGTADELLAAANSDGTVYVTLLPAGYEPYGYFSIDEDGRVFKNSTYSFVSSKTAAVEQFSHETSYAYNNGFALSPENAILNFTITGLAASTPVDVSLKGGNYNITKTVTTDGDGNAVFATGIGQYEYLENFSLTVGGKAITLVSSSKRLDPGKIYNITRSAAPALTYPIALNEVTSDYVGSVITSDGYVYATVSDATAASKTAVAMICYVGAAGSADNSTGSEAYKGLALALSDAGTGKWCSQHSVNCLTSQYDIGQQTNDMAGIANTDYLIDHDPDGHGHTAASVARNYSVARPTGTSAWFLPSAGQWDKMVNACKKVLGTNNNYTDLRDGFSARGGTNLLKDHYRTSTENTIRFAFRFDFSSGNNGNSDYKYLNSCVRPVFAF